MDPRQIIRSGVTASAVVHLSFLAVAIVFSEVHPFAPVAAENVAVDIVTPDQVPEKAPEPPPKPEPKPSNAFDLSSKPAPESSPPKSAPAAAAQPPPAPQQATSQPQPQTPPQKQAALAQPKPSPSSVPSPAAGPAPNPAQNPAPQPAAQPQASLPAQPPPAYAQPQPDISIKYHVLLGLPQERPGDGFDAPATENADIGSDPIAEFRRRLKTCSTLPKSVAPTDDVAIKLRVMLTRDGRLAADPLLIEAKASMKGPLLMQSAIRALQSCQPFAMLPADKYDEWKVLDLNFTPRDFGGS